MDNLLGEFMGTLVLIVFGCGVNANMALKKTCGNGGGWICTTTGWAFAVLLGPNVEMLAGATDAMSMASTIVDAVQSSPTTATVMLCCSLGVILLTIINIIFAIIDSKWGENKYGPSPKYH